MSLETPEKIRNLQRKLYRKAKAEPAFRFYVLYDKICREDMLRHAHVLARANAGSPGVDGVTFAQIEAEGVEKWLDYIFGLARNERLEAKIAPALQDACLASRRSGQAARVFRDFMWSTKESWSRRRRVIAKAEWTTLGPNPRFIVTSLKPKRWAARALYEDLYCARGDMENRIKECQLDLGACPRAGLWPDPGADRTSAHTMRANQLRLWFASFAYVLICALRRLGLAHTRLADATCGTIRLKLLKIGAQVRVSVRRVKIAMASACPYADEFALAHARICAAAR